MHDRFLRACRREPTDCTPVWFMRQAGRYMPEYRALRAKYSMLELCRTPELALQVTLQPVRAMPVDAAILFADILLPLEPMGAPFSFAPNEGPVIHAPVRDAAAIDKLRVFDPREGLCYVLESVRLIRRELDGKVPLIGFAGAPFTLASYLVEGGKSAHYETTKRLMYSEPVAWNALMSKLADVTAAYLRAQAEAGAQALQLFDSWVGALSRRDYVEFVQPHVRTIFASLADLGLPLIHFGTGTTAILTAQRDAGGTVIGVDWREPIGEAWARIGHDRAVQGNLDPLTLFAPLDVLKSRVDDVLDGAAGRVGHVFNLGHGILPGTPVDNVKRVVDYVHERSAKR